MRRALHGLADTLSVLKQVARVEISDQLPPPLRQLDELSSGEPTDLEELIRRMRAVQQPAQDLLQLFPAAETDPRAYWAQQVARQVGAWNAVIDRYLRPIEILMEQPAQLMSLGEAAHEARREALTALFSLRNIAVEGIPGSLRSSPFTGDGRKLKCRSRARLA